MALTKRERRLKIKQRIRKRISGTGERPRMSVFRSNKQIYVQLVNDLTGETLVSASSKNVSYQAIPDKARRKRHGFMGFHEEKRRKRRKKRRKGQGAAITDCGVSI